jgi:S1-C subfamily serine protease
MPIQFNTLSRISIVIFITSLYTLIAIISYIKYNPSPSITLSLSDTTNSITVLLYAIASISIISLLTTLAGIRKEKSPRQTNKIPIQNDLYGAISISIVAFISTLLFVQRGEDISLVEIHSKIWTQIIIFGFWITLSSVVSIVVANRTRLGWTLIGIFICVFSVRSYYYEDFWNKNIAQKDQSISAKNIIASPTNIPQQPTSQPLCNEQTTLNTAKKCTYRIIRNDKGHGSGFSTKSGFLITNKHVIENATSLTVWVNDEVEAKVWNYDQNQDIAILKVEEPTQTCQWYDSKNLEVAETLYTVGWPLDASGESTVTKGIYSRVLDFKDGTQLLQTDAAINPGNSGGPLVNKCGIVGVNTSKMNAIDDAIPEGLGFALSSQKIQLLTENLITNGSIRPIPKGNTAKTVNPPAPKAPTLNVKEELEEIRQYLSQLRIIYTSWENARGSVPDEDLNKLLDSLTRQIRFCETLEQRISQQGRITQDDIIMWQSVLKMSQESAEITRKLNSQ